MRKFRTELLILLVPVFGVAVVCGFGHAPSPQSEPDAPRNDARMAATSPLSATLTTFGDGTYGVPTTVEPGVYVTAVPATSYLCYWEIFDDAKKTDIEHTINSGTPVATEFEQITIPANAKKFRTKGCGKWTLLTRLPQPYQSSP